MVISGTSQSHLDAAAKSLASHSGRVSAVQADVRRYDEVESADGHRGRETSAASTS